MGVVPGPGPQGWSMNQRSMFCVHPSVTVAHLIYNSTIEDGITGGLTTNADLPTDR